MGYYKVRLTPRIDKTRALFLTAGWEARTLLLLLDLGVHLNEMGIDNRVCGVLDRNPGFISVPRFKYRSPNEDQRQHPRTYQPDHAFLPTEKVLSVFSALGVPRGRLVGSPGAGSVGSVIVGETTPRKMPENISDLSTCRCVPLKMSSGRHLGSQTCACSPARRAPTRARTTYPWTLSWRSRSIADKSGLSPRVESAGHSSGRRE